LLRWCKTDPISDIPFDRRCLLALWTLNSIRVSLYAASETEKWRRLCQCCLHRWRSAATRQTKRQFNSVKAFCTLNSAAFGQSRPSVLLDWIKTLFYTDRQIDNVAQKFHLESARWGPFSFSDISAKDNAPFFEAHCKVSTSLFLFTLHFVPHAISC